MNEDVQHPQEDTMDAGREGRAQAAETNGTAPETGPAESAPAAEQADHTEVVVEQLEAEVQSLREQLMRQAAEFRNYRRRTEEEKQTMVALGKSMVVQQMLEVYDDFTRSREAALQAGEQAPEQTLASLSQGVDLVYRKFSEEMKKLGVEPIQAEGQPFDENLHDAMMRQPAPKGVEPGTVLQEVQAGYRMGDRILRHSKVIVAA